MKKKPKDKTHPYTEERRKYKRITKNFLLTYFEKENPTKKYEITQLKNISMGGICFITTQAFEKSTHLCISLETPYLSETTYLEGLVLKSHEKATNLLYETRLQFACLDPQAEFVISKLIEFFMNGDAAKNEEN